MLNRAVATVAMAWVCLCLADQARCQSSGSAQPSKLTASSSPPAGRTHGDCLLFPPKRQMPYLPNGKRLHRRSNPHRLLRRDAAGPGPHGHDRFSGPQEPSLRPSLSRHRPYARPLRRSQRSSNSLEACPESMEPGRKEVGVLRVRAVEIAVYWQMNTGILRYKMTPLEQSREGYPGKLESTSVPAERETLKNQRPFAK